MLWGPVDPLSPVHTAVPPTIAAAARACAAQVRGGMCQFRNIQGWHDGKKDVEKRLPDAWRDGRLRTEPETRSKSASHMVGLSGGGFWGQEVILSRGNRAVPERCAG